MKLSKLASLIGIGLLVACAAPASAQTACPVGTPAGSATCGPSSYYTEPPPSTPSGEWINRFGAVASDVEGVGNIGVAQREPSRTEAEKKALAQCMSLGSRQCKVTLWYANQCASLASPYAGDKPIAGINSPGIGLDTQTASRNALERCSDKNKGASCKVVYASCSDPVFRKY